MFYGSHWWFFRCIHINLWCVCIFPLRFLQVHWVSFSPFPFVFLFLLFHLFIFVFYCTLWIWDRLVIKVLYIYQIYVFNFICLSVFSKFLYWVDIRRIFFERSIYYYILVTFFSLTPPYYIRRLGLVFFRLHRYNYSLFHLKSGFFYWSLLFVAIYYYFPS